ncbi:hypothetical protein [Streptomyces sp. NPDC050287]
MPVFVDGVGAKTLPAVMIVFAAVALIAVALFPTGIDFPAEINEERQNN